MPKKPTEVWYSIPEAATELKLSGAYVRLMVREGVIQTKSVPVREGSHVMKHLISEKELELFATREGRRAPRRDDGRGKHFFYATDEEVLRVKELLYQAHDDGLAIVAQSVDGGIPDEQYYVSPSKLRSGGE